MKKDVYQEITDKIINQLEKGVVPWHKPWISANPAYSRGTGREYSLLNQLQLDKGGEYVTYLQAKKDGGNIKKGAKAQKIVFWKLTKIKDKETEEEKIIPLLKYSNVFHISDTEGLEPKKEDTLVLSNLKPEEKAEKIINSYIEKENINLVKELSNRAYYQPASDKVVLPIIEQFTKISEYYSTVFHELVHSTGTQSRCNRNLKGGKKTSSYKKEELVAEIGASMMLNKLGFEDTSSFENNVSYINGYLLALKNDKKLIVQAASQSKKAIEFIEL